jgi:membrane-associated phospholipid phosphatase
MISTVKKVYRKFFAGILLLIAEITLGAVIFIVSLAGFLVIAKYVFLDNKVAFDMSAFQFMDSFISDRNSSIILFLTKWGNYQLLVTANLLLIGYFLFVKKHKWYSIKIPSVALSSVLVMTLLKALFNRPRPLIPLLEPASGFSFPSGHAMSSVTFYGLLIYFIWKQKKLNKPIRIGIVTFLVLFILAIGISRVYLRVHYASDVIAGFFVGFIWLTIAIMTIDKIEAYTKRNLRKTVEDPDNSNSTSVL